MICRWRSPSLSSRRPSSSQSAAPPRGGGRSRSRPAFFPFWRFSPARAIKADGVNRVRAHVGASGSVFVGFEHALSLIPLLTLLLFTRPLVVLPWRLGIGSHMTPWCVRPGLIASPRSQPTGGPPPY